MQYLENEIIKLQEKLENKSNKKNLSFYENGKYSDNIRMVYEDLLSMGLISRNVEKSGLLKSFEFGNGSRMSDENLVILEFKYLQNKKW